MSIFVFKIHYFYHALKKTTQLGFAKSIKLLLLFVFNLAPLIAFSHSGGLNKDGCHRETRTGGYHCHNGTTSVAPSTPVVPVTPVTPVVPITPVTPVVPITPVTPVTLVTPTPAATSIVGRVIAVADGDTLTIQNSTGLSVIRLAEIDAPEKCQPYGGASRTSLANLALNKDATVLVTDKDKYGRTVGKVTVNGQTESVNKIQLRVGLAWVYDAYAQDPSLNGIENSARLSNSGLWAGPNPIEPWIWRSAGYGCSRDPEIGVTVGGAPVTTTTSDYLTIYEYYNSSNNHYFMTASVAEANAIDAGSAGPGWNRTGNTLKAWKADANQQDALSVCRFYTLGANSHFFTANAGECQALRNIETAQRQVLTPQQQFKGWQYEGTAFKIKTPNPDGLCPAGTETVHRAYNKRHAENDPNHRFTPWIEDFNDLIAKGWVYEGVAMCAPI